MSLSNEGRKNSENTMVNSTIPTGVDTPHSVSEGEMASFSSDETAQLLIKSSQQDPHSEYIAVKTRSRYFKAATGGDGFFAQTLGTQATIPCVITLRRRKIHETTSALVNDLSSACLDQSISSISTHPPDTITLVLLNTPGACGHPNIAHGGLIATLFDEAMSLAMALHVHSKSAEKPSQEGQKASYRNYTVQLNLRYKAPVIVPGVLVIRSWCVKSEGRKYWTLGAAVQHDEKGNVKPRADGSAFWISIPIQSKI
jgi:acyl-coenzyme A thioesterase PaaI-like protein